MDDTNNYKLLGTNVPGLQSGYVFQIPNLTIGGNAALNGYMPKGNNKYEELDRPVNLKKIKKLLRNPR